MLSDNLLPSVLTEGPLPHHEDLGKCPAIGYATSQFGYLPRLKRIPHLVLFLNLAISPLQLHFSLSKEVLFYSLSLHQALFSHWLSGKADAWLHFCYHYWFCFPFKWGRILKSFGQEREGGWILIVCQQMPTHITAIEGVGRHGNKLSSPVPTCWLTLLMVTEHGRPMGPRILIHLHKAAILWDVKRESTWGSSKRDMVPQLPCDWSPLPLSHFFHTADHISLGQQPEKCAQAILGRRAYKRGCPFHSKILYKACPAWFPKTSSLGLASGNSWC